jgi:hypothetical protein
MEAWPVQRRRRTPTGHGALTSCSPLDRVVRQTRQADVTVDPPRTGRSLCAAAAAFRAEGPLSDSDTRKCVVYTSYSLYILLQIANYYLRFRNISFFENLI